jgi:crotonobetaine/carnitine-CoA ligase
VRIGATLTSATNDRQSFAAHWNRAVENAADSTFLSWEGSDDQLASWTYGEFAGVVSEVGNHLTDRGVRPGSRVHVALTNSPAFVAIWLACAQLGAVLVPSDPLASKRELGETIARTAPVIGIGSLRRAEDYRAGAGSTGLAVQLIDEDDVEFPSLRNTRDAAKPLDPDPLSPLGIMFTSGTTSRPKGVVLTQANYAFAGQTMARAAQLGQEDRQLVVLPLFHANAQYYSFASAIAVGAGVALVHTFSASRFLTQAATHGATHASLFAAPIRMILARSDARPDDLQLRHCWYAQNLTDRQYQEIAALLGCRPRQLYGMTETVPAVITSDPDDAVPDVMGRQTEGCQVRLEDPESGTPTADGQVGEIVVGGRPGVEIFAEYLDDPETTAASFRGGWFRTGDLAVRDERGRIRFAGRRGEVLKVAGENVSTVEIESVLAEHPAVYESAVVGAPDPIRDEIPIAYVVLRDGQSAAADDLLAWCADRLAKSKRPHEIRFVAELPRTSVGKIRKFMLT